MPVLSAVTTALHKFVSAHVSDPGTFYYCRLHGEKSVGGDFCFETWFCLGYIRGAGPRLMTIVPCEFDGEACRVYYDRGTAEIELFEYLVTLAQITWPITCDFSRGELVTFF